MTPRKFTIAVDVDDTVANLIDRWLALYNADYGDDLTAERVTRWEISKCVKKECGTKIWQYLERADLYEEVQPVNLALWGVNRLREMGHRAIFVTSCGRHASTIARAGDKFNWLVDQGFFSTGTQPVEHPYLDFVVCADKTQVAADLIIDDRADTIEAWVKQGRKCILVDRPHNRSRASLDAVRARGWPEIVERVQMYQDIETAGVLVSGLVSELKPRERVMMLSAESAERKNTPITTGVLDYFPLAIAAVARVSKKGNDKHNPGQPLHWARGKSMDQADTIARHLLDRGAIDPDSGELHEAALAWRALAMLELAEEARLGKPVARGSEVQHG